MGTGGTRGEKSEAREDRQGDSTCPLYLRNSRPRLWLADNWHWQQKDATTPLTPWLPCSGVAAGEGPGRYEELWAAATSTGLAQ